MNIYTVTMISLLLLSILFFAYANPTDNTMNNNISMELHSIIRPDIEISVIIMACVVCCIVTVGIIGNVLVICVLTCNQTRMVYETFCVGLAVTDLIYLTMTSPITVMQYFLNSWIFGIFWCKVFNFIVQVTVFSSAFMLLGLTTSRFLAVVLPWQNLKMTEIQAKLVCLGAWLVGIIFALPIIIFQVLIPIPRDDILPDNITVLITTTSTNAMQYTTHYLTEISQTYTVTSTQSYDLIKDYFTNNNYNQEVFCREQFPTQSSRMGYQLFVLLSTYVLPFACILILNTCIVLKLKQKNVAERETSQFKRSSMSKNSVHIKNNNKNSSINNDDNTNNNISNTDESFNSNHKTNWFKKKQNKHFSIRQKQHESNRSVDIHEDISHDHRQQQRLEQQLSNDTMISDYASTTSNVGPGLRFSTNNDSMQNNDSHENTHQNPSEIIRATRELKKKRLRSKATKLVVLVTTLWGVCWLPTHIINSWFFFDEASFPFVPAMKIAKLLSQTLSFAASCVNPVVYSILTGSFKTALSNRLLRFRKHKRHDHPRTETLYVTE
ncbi:Allatostatin-A receptor [Schistosoma japonicum]|uniref:Allatostatin-A receptor n=1 Tax=Schistosoma japonicum TaxID=6182 RepID=A0A4Z2CYY8_SCHJA|nr:Protein trapped in endoderm-1 [Schistosoma japonicum]TNN09130.1 Allatostatin-A receptor [Schistosoma japonicum]